MLKLMLMRHAKAAPPHMDAEDFERRLSGRGLEAAPAMGRALAKHKLVPKQILCSPAQRTRETLQLVVNAMGVTAPVAFEDRLYDFGDGLSYMEVISDQNGATPLMVIGHNPSVQNMALRLIGPKSSAIAERIGRKFPTAAVAVIALPIEAWRQVESGGTGRGEVELFLTPKTIEG